MKSWPWPSIIMNVAVFGGLGTAGVGLWLYKPWLSLTVIGFVIFGGAVWSMNKRPNHREGADDNDR